MTAPELRALLSRCARGRTLLVWDGDRFHAVTPEALRLAINFDTENDTPARGGRAAKAPELEDK